MKTVLSLIFIITVFLITLGCNSNQQSESPTKPISEFELQHGMEPITSVANLQEFNPATAKRGSESGAWSVFALFNTGLVMLLVSHLGDIHNLFPVAARMVMGIAVFIFVLLIWNRVVTYRHLG